MTPYATSTGPDGVFRVHVEADDYTGLADTLQELLTEGDHSHGSGSGEGVQLAQLTDQPPPGGWPVAHPQPRRRPKATQAERREAKKARDSTK